MHRPWDCSYWGCVREWAYGLDGGVFEWGALQEDVLVGLACHGFVHRVAADQFDWEVEPPAS
jgi:hypothetical protein